MRLINVGTLEMKEFFDSNAPNYAILSHTWGDQEVSFADWQAIASLPELLAARPSAEDDAYTALQRRKVDALKQREGYQKIIRFCEAVSNNTGSYSPGWAWIDTCCIDKTSSSELSEAINSMFRWYQNASICYAYLADVPCDLARPIQIAALQPSRWFARGWTLQELLAPREVVFFDKGWDRIGSKSDPALGSHIQEITGIQPDYLRHNRTLSDASISNRMSWASKRETTRSEDMAYCLLGIFDVHMPLLYGEGQHAFTRLQEEILKSSTDHTIFSWGFDLPIIETSSAYKYRSTNGFDSLLAPTPAYFAGASELRDFGQETHDSFQMTNKGLKIMLKILRCGNHYPPLYFATLFEKVEQAQLQHPRRLSLGFLLGHRREFAEQYDSSDPEISDGDVLQRLPAGGPMFVVQRPEMFNKSVERTVYIPKYSHPWRRRIQAIDFAPGFDLILPVQQTWRVVEVFPPLPRQDIASNGYRGDSVTIIRFSQDDYSTTSAGLILRSNTLEGSKSDTAQRMTWFCRVEGPASFVLGIQVPERARAPAAQPSKSNYRLMAYPATGLAGTSLLESYANGFPAEGWADTDEPITICYPNMKLKFSARYKASKGWRLWKEFTQPDLGISVSVEDR